MNKEIKKDLATTASGFAAYVLSSAVIARTTCNPAPPDDWNCVQYQSGMSTTYTNAPANILFEPSGGITRSFRFEGDTAASYNFSNTDCSHTKDDPLKGDEKRNTTTTQVRATNSEAAAGDALCSQIDLVNFPRTSNLPHKNDDVLAPYGGFTAAMLKNLIDTSEMSKSA